MYYKYVSVRDWLSNNRCNWPGAWATSGLSGTPPTGAGGPGTGLRRHPRMNPFGYFKDILTREVGALARAGDLPAGLDAGRATMEPARDPAHGDLTTNAAMVLAKDAGMKPRDLAARLAERLAALSEVVGAEVAGPGFINLSLAPEFWHQRLAEVLRAGKAYGDSDLGAGEAVNVEFVSVNPTGPLHLGHARGAVVGDVLASLLEKAGYKVTREFYINDAGFQIEQLAYSTYFRYREALGEEIGEEAFNGFFPSREWEYRGDYLKDAGAALADKYGDRYLDAASPDWLPVFRDFAVDAMMDLIKADMAALGIRHDVFSSECDLVEADRVEAALATLEDKGLIYTGTLEPPKGKTPEDWEPRPQTLFRSTEFGDDVDRPLKKSDGSWTYFATDVAYHHDKLERGFRTMIDVWGADHGGYVKRMGAAVKAFGKGAATLDVKLCQMVRLLEAGRPAKMSKRAGAFVTLSDLVERVGKDVVRFIMLTRKNDSPLDFDLVKVLEQSRDNPVFYVQYAHARCRSVMRLAAERFSEAELAPERLAGAELARLADTDELGLIKLLAGWPRIVESAAEAHEPHRLAFYLHDLAGAFHALWTRGKEESGLRFLVAEDRALTLARLALVQGVATVIASGLSVMGVEPVEELRE